MVAQKQFFNLVPAMDHIHITDAEYIRVNTANLNNITSETSQQVADVVDTHDGRLSVIDTQLSDADTGIALLNSSFDTLRGRVDNIRTTTLTPIEIGFLENVRRRLVSTEYEKLTTARVGLLDTTAPTAAQITGINTDNFTRNTEVFDQVLYIRLPVAQVTTDLVIATATDGGPDAQVTYEDFDSVTTDLSSNFADSEGLRLYWVGRALDSSRNYHYIANTIIDIQEVTEIEQYTVTTDVDMTQNVSGLELNQLSETVRAYLLGGSAGLTALDKGKLDGLEATTTNGPFTTDNEVAGLVGYGEATLSDDHYRMFGNININGIRALEETRRVQVLVGTNTVLLTAESEGAAPTVIPERIGVLTIGDTSYNHYQIELPAITPGFGNFLEASVYRLTGTIGAITLTGAVDSFKINIDNLSQRLRDVIFSSTPPPNPAENLPEVLRFLSEALTRTVTTPTNMWELRDEGPASRIPTYPVAAALWTENRRRFSGNFWNPTDDIVNRNRVAGNPALGPISSLSSVVVETIPSNNLFFYPDPNDEDNLNFPGASSYVLNRSININVDNSYPSRTLQIPNKIIMFDYALQNRLPDDFNQPMFNMGSQTPPIMGLSEAQGLYLNIGREDGGVRTRNYAIPLTVENNQIGTRVGQSTNSTAVVVIPESAVINNAFTLVLTIAAYLNDVQEESVLTVLSVANINNNQTYPQITVSVNHTDGDGNLIRQDQSFTVAYVARDTTLGTPRHVMTVSTATPISNAAFHYNVTAAVNATDTWVAPTTYARFPTNAGDGHDDFGIFDPRRYNTEHIHERNRVLIYLRSTERRDGAGAESELSATVIVDGILHTENGTSPINLHRNLTATDWNSYTFGGNGIAVSHLQIYTVDENQRFFTTSELMEMYNLSGRYMDRIRFNDTGIADFELNAGWTINLASGLMLTEDTSGDKYTVSIVNGQLTATRVEDD